MAVSADGENRLALQKRVEDEARKWGHIWLKFAGRARTPWRDYGSDLLNKFPWLTVLEPIRGRDLAVHGKTFRETTGIGSDDFHPRWFGWLPTELLDNFAKLLNNAERHGVWPEQLYSILVCLIPKAEGGVRPIGLLTSLVRVWSRIRKVEVQRWRELNFCDYKFAANGRSAETAVWRQSVLEEAAATRGKATASELVDLTNAYELCRLELVWLAAIKVKFPLHVLRMELEAYVGTRRLMMKGAVADGIDTYSALLAGGTFATDGLFLVMQGVVDGILVEHPRDLVSNSFTSITLYIDDLGIHVEGTEAEIAGMLARATRTAVQILEEDLQLTVSKSSKPWELSDAAKTVAVVPRLLAEAVGPGQRAIGVKTVSHTKWLGIDYTAGARAQRKVLNARLSKVCSRAARMKRMGARGGTHMLKTGGVPALRFGVIKDGATKGMISKVRKLAGTMRGKTKRRSLFARLTLTKYDPGSDLILAPLVAWAKGLWDNLVPKTAMKEAWTHGLGTVGLSTDCGKVYGAAGAAVIAINRLGWKFSRFDAVTTRSGTVLSLRAVSVTTLVKHARRQISDDFAEQSSWVKVLGGIPELAALGSVVGGKAKRTPGAGSLRALGEGAWWTQRDWHIVGRSATDSCQLCKAQRGTFNHAVCGCSERKEIYDKYRNQDVVHRARSALHADDPMYKFGIPLRRPRASPPPRQSNRVSA